MSCTLLPLYQISCSRPLKQFLRDARVSFSAWLASFLNWAPRQRMISVDILPASCVLEGLHLVCTLERLTFFWTSYDEKKFSKTELGLRWGNRDAQKLKKKKVLWCTKKVICIWNIQVKKKCLLCSAQIRSFNLCLSVVMIGLSILHQSSGTECIWELHSPFQQANSHLVNTPNISYQLRPGRAGTWIAIFQHPLRRYSEKKKTVSG